MRIDARRLEVLRRTACEVLSARGLDMVEVSAHGSGSTWRVLVLTDRPEGGITMEECLRVHRELRDSIDDRGVFEDGYDLEVASPGLDRPLRTPGDYRRCLGRRVRLRLDPLGDDRGEIEGIVRGVEGDDVVIERVGRSEAIPLSSIVKGMQCIGLKEG